MEEKADRPRRVDEELLLSIARRMAQERRLRTLAVSILHAAGFSARETAAAFGIGRSTAYRHFSDLYRISGSLGRSDGE